MHRSSPSLPYGAIGTRVSCTSAGCCAVRPSWQLRYPRSRRIVWQCSNDDENLLCKIRIYRLLEKSDVCKFSKNAPWSANPNTRVQLAVFSACSEIRVHRGGMGDKALNFHWPLVPLFKHHRAFRCKVVLFFPTRFSPSATISLTFSPANIVSLEGQSIAPTPDAPQFLIFQPNKFYPIAMQVYLLFVHVINLFLINLKFLSWV